MLENDFLISLNKMVITDSYDSVYFNNIFEMLKKYCDADAVIMEDADKNTAVSEYDIEFKISAIDKKIIIKNIKKVLVDREFFINMVDSILNNIFENYLIVEKLKKEKYIDSLLGINNRTAYDELLQEKRKFNKCGVVFIDANGLSIINNRYGHEEGDKFLITTCDAFKNFFRYSDIYRFGGDELVIVCEGIDEALFNEKVQKALEEISSTSYTVSVGAIYEESIDNLFQVIKDASIVMKKNKEEYRKQNPDRYISKYDVTYIGKRDK